MRKRLVGLLMALALCLALLPVTALAMKIFVESPEGGYIGLEVEPTDSIAKVKAQLLEQKSTLPDQLELAYDGTMLEESGTLQIYSIQDRETLQIMLPLDYLDADGSQKSCTAEVLGKYSCAWGKTGEEHWYTATGDVEIGYRVTVQGNVHLILTDGCHLTVPNGINVSDDDHDPANGSANSLTIYAQSGGEHMGKLTASVPAGSMTDAQSQAAIGGGWGQDAGVITINGGYIEADSCQDDFAEDPYFESAAIGGGGGQWQGGGGGGSITVNGGVITARSVSGAAIGCGVGYGGVVVINGGTVTARSEYNAAIGVGMQQRSETNGRIEINGGTVVCSGDGFGLGAENGTIGICGGDVTAEGRRGVGIGGAGSVVTISGGSVSATGSLAGAGIGGDWASSRSITISGGVVTAIGGEKGGAGIGGSSGVSGGAITSVGGIITITGGEITATGGPGAAGIGGGAAVYHPADEQNHQPEETRSGSGGTITISGGVVTATGGAGTAPDENGTGHMPGSGIGDGGSDLYQGTEYAPSCPAGFATGEDGNAFITATAGGEPAPAISDTSGREDWHGVIVEGPEGRVYGGVTMTGSATLSENVTLTVPADTSLTVPDGMTLTNNGVIVGAVFGEVRGSGIVKPLPPVAVTGVTLDRTELALCYDRDNTGRLTAAVVPADASDRAVTWTSSDSAVAEVDETGLVTAHAAGTAVITVTTEDGGFTADCAVTVAAFQSGSPSGGSSGGGHSSGDPSKPAESEPSTEPEQQADAGNDRFADVPAGMWYESAVAFVTGNGLFRGTSETTFAPNVPMTRAMLATVLHRLAKEPAGGEQRFADVPGDAWYAEAVAWAAGEGIVTGLGSGAFAPDAPITREQLVVMLYRYAVRSGLEAVTLEENLTAFRDADRISPYAIQSLNWAVGQGIITGRGGGLLDPQGQATRAEVAAILMRCADLTK